MSVHTIEREDHGHAVKGQGWRLQLCRDGSRAHSCTGEPNLLAVCVSSPPEARKGSAEMTTVLAPPFNYCHLSSAADAVWLKSSPALFLFFDDTFGFSPGAQRPKARIEGEDAELGLLADQIAWMWGHRRGETLKVSCQAYAVLAVERLQLHVSENVLLPCRASASANKIQKALQYIENNLGRAHTLEELSVVAGASPYHFARTFRQEVGRSPHQYVLERRIAAAKRMLVSSREPIAAIAHDCGFGSQSHMTDVFRRLLDTTPGQLREPLN